MTAAPNPTPRYATAHQASKAVAQNPVFLDDALLVGVTSLDHDIAKRLGFMFNDDGTAAVARPMLGWSNPGGGGGANAARPYEGPGSRQMRQGMPRRPYTMGDDTSILQPPKRHVNCCKKLMQWVFDW